jgi:hypothetical protein
MPVGGWCQCGKAEWMVDGVEKWGPPERLDGGIGPDPSALSIPSSREITFVDRYRCVTAPSICFLPLVGPQGGGRDENRMLYDVGHDEDAPDDSQREIGDQEYGNRDGEHHLKPARPANLVGAAKPQSRGLPAVALARPRRSVRRNG